MTQLVNALEHKRDTAQTAQHGRARRQSLHIKNQLQQRQGVAETNFHAHLPAAESAMARETMKDPNLFDFLGMGMDMVARE